MLTCRSVMKGYRPRASIAGPVITRLSTSRSRVQQTKSQSRMNVEIVSCAPAFDASRSLLSLISKNSQRVVMSDVR